LGKVGQKNPSGPPKCKGGDTRNRQKYRQTALVQILREAFRGKSREGKKIERVRLPSAQHHPEERVSNWNCPKGISTLTEMRFLSEGEDFEEREKVQKTWGGGVVKSKGRKSGADS